MPVLQGLIFDLDGTLMDSAADLRQALNTTLAADSRRALTLDEVKSLTGDGLGPMLRGAYALTGSPLDKAALPACFDRFKENYMQVKPDRSQLYPHVIETFDMLKKHGVKIGLCTNKIESATLRLMQDLKLTAYFDFIAGGDTFANYKPHRDHVLGVIHKLKVPAANCVMIGDGPNDVQAAHSAKISCLVVTHGYAHQDPAKLGGDGMIDSFLQLPEALKKLGFELK